MKRALASAAVLAFLSLTVPACSAADDEGGFAAEEGDEAVDPSDPPVTPDPDGPEGAVGSTTQGLQAGCPDYGKLSPTGMNLVIQIPRHDDDARITLANLKVAKAGKYIRATDAFMVWNNAMVPDLAKEFPCNRIFWLAYPEHDGEMQDALNSGDEVAGVVVDWELHAAVNNPKQTADKLHSYVQAIHAKKKVAGVAPYYPKAYNDGAILHASQMQFEFAQFQDRCQRSVGEYANATKKLVGELKSKGESPRNISVEMTLDAAGNATHRVSPARAVECTRAAFGKGARSFYIYGQQGPLLLEYLKGLAKKGLRRPQ
jgi:hypothetical protein